MSNPIPQDHMVINTFNSPVKMGVVIGVGTQVLVPWQQNGVQSVKPDAALQNIMPIGWDWLPERLRCETYKGIRVFGLSPSHKLHEVEALLNKLNFVVKNIEVSESEMDAAAPVQKKPWVGPGNPKEIMKPSYGPMNSTPPPSGEPQAGMYGRVRFLWKTHHQQFVPFEKEFVESLGKQLKLGKTLSPKQANVLNRILDKYRVPKDATASTETF